MKLNKSSYSMSEFQVVANIGNFLKNEKDIPTNE